MKLACYSKESIYSTLVLSLLMLCGFYIRVGYWPDYYYSNDDLWHLVIANQDSIMGVIKANLAEDVHPPLSYLILHFMLKISDNQYFLRCISLVPGMLLIPMAYLLGKERIGLAGATTMAFLVTFGEWITLLSSAIRAYSLMLLCITFALWAMYRFDKTQLKRYVYGYFIAMFLAIELVHSVAFFIFAIGSWWFLKNIRQKEKWKFLFWWSVGHIVLMACLLMYVKAIEYKVMPYYFPGAYYEGFQSLMLFYLGQFLLFLHGNSSTGNILIFIVVLIFFLQILGMAKRGWDVLFLVFSLFILLAVADYLALFPFNDFVRGYIFWAIPIYLAIGIVTQHLYDKMLATAKEHEISAKAIMSCLGLMMGVLAVFLVAHAKEEMFYKKSYSGWFEASLPEPEIHKALSFLEKNVQPGDVIITSSDSTWALRYLFHPLPITRHNGYVAETKLFSTPVYFDGRPSRIYNQYANPYVLQKFFKELQGIVDFSHVRKFWFIHLGWENDMIVTAIKPRFIPAVEGRKCLWERCEEYRDQFKREDYALLWKFILSPEVAPRSTYFNNGATAVAYGVTPHFVEEALIKPSFMDRDIIFATAVEKIASKRFRIKHE